MSSAQNQASDKVRARRRALRGAFAVPVVSVIPVGSAWAASVTNCLKNQVQAGQMGGTSNVCTVAVYVDTTNTNRCWVKGSDFAVHIKSGKACFISSNQWLRWDPSTNKPKYSNQSYATVTANGPSPSNCKPNTSPSATNVLFDVDGNIVGCGLYKYTASANSAGQVSSSCAASFKLSA